MRHRTLLVSLLLVLTGCAATDQINPDHTAARARARTEVQERMTAYGAAVRSGDIASIMGFWAPDAVIQENESQVEGPEVTVKAQEFFPHNRIVEFAVETYDLQAHDDGSVAYQWGQLREVIQPNDGGPSSSYRTNFLARWVRADDGVWRIHHFLAVPAPKQPAAAAWSKASDTPVGSLQDVLAQSQVLETMKHYVVALRSNLADSIMTFWTEDARFNEPDAQYVGKPAIDAAVRKVLADQRLTGVDWSSREIFVHDDGDSAYQFGSYTETLVARGQRGPGQVSRCNFVARWRRGADGGWRMDAFLAAPAPRQ